MRWLALPSIGLGEDWEERIIKIDRSLEVLGHELADESVYLLFSHTPREILSGMGHCLVARSVTGPRKVPDEAFLLKDWTAKEVWKSSIEGATLNELVQSAQKLDPSARSQEKQTEGGFILCLQRRLGTGLSLTIEAIFPE